MDEDLADGLIVAVGENLEDALREEIIEIRDPFNIEEE